MYCKVSGIPKPILTWYKVSSNVPLIQYPHVHCFQNGEISSTPRNETKRIRISENNEEIIFLQTIVQDEGIYECKAKNRIGSTMKQQTVKFKSKVLHKIYLKNTLIPFFHFQIDQNLVHKVGF